MFGRFPLEIVRRLWRYTRSILQQWILLAGGSIVGAGILAMNAFVGPWAWGAAVVACVVCFFFASFRVWEVEYIARVDSRRSIILPGHYVANRTKTHSWAMPVAALILSASLAVAFLFAGPRVANRINPPNVFEANLSGTTGFIDWAHPVAGRTPGAAVVATVTVRNIGGVPSAAEGWQGSIILGANRVVADTLPLGPGVIATSVSTGQVVHFPSEDSLVERTAVAIQPGSAVSGVLIFFFQGATAQQLQSAAETLKIAFNDVQNNDYFVRVPEKFEHNDLVLPVPGLKIP